MITLKKILVPTDFSDCSKKAMDYALSLAKEFKSEVLILHVIDTRGYETAAIYNLGPMEEARKAVQKMSQEMMANFLKEKGIDESRIGDKIILEGAPFIEIIRVAREKEVDLIVIGTHGRTGVSHILFGSVAEKVVRKAPCPVLTVKPEEHEFVMP
jgi:nucleotide-binding universal stress UspA family protein